jgi:hypothetical protein
LTECRLNHGFGGPLHDHLFKAGGEGSSIESVIDSDDRLDAARALYRRAVIECANDAEQQQHLVLLNKLAHLFDGLRRTVAVVTADEVDLAPVDSALLIDHGEVGGLRLADDAVG